MKFKYKKNLKKLERKRVGVHPDPSRNIFLHRNERVMPYDKRTMGLLCERIANSYLNLYPDVELFYEKLSRWLSLDENEIYLTEGVSGAIKALFEAVAEPGKKIVFPTPTYAMYPVYCKMFSFDYRTPGYTKDYKLDMDAMYSLIDKKIAIVFLPNPNVPIEGTLGLGEIAALAKHCARNDSFLVVDEVYYLFGAPTAIGLINRFNNLFVMRSFSKGFGLPSIRLGYLVGTKKNISYVSKMRTGYEANTLSCETASFFIDNYHIVEAYIRDVKKGLRFLKSEFDKLGLSYNSQDTSNFIYVDTGNKALAAKIVNGLKKKNIHVRGGWPRPYSTGLVVTGGPKPVMRKFVRELKGEMLKVERLRSWKR